MDMEEVNDASFSILTYGQFLSDRCNAQLSLGCMWIHLYLSIRSKQREIIRWQSGTVAQVSLFLPIASAVSTVRQSVFPVFPWLPSCSNSQIHCKPLILHKLAWTTGCITCWKSSNYVMDGYLCTLLVLYIPHSQAMFGVFCYLV